MVAPQKVAPQHYDSVYSAAVNDCLLAFATIRKENPDLDEGAIATIVLAAELRLLRTQK